MREIVNGRAFDETYTMEAEPKEHGLYRFASERKYPEGNLNGDEALAFGVFQNTANGAGDPDFISDVKVAFFDEDGREVHTYEKELWNLQGEE